MTAPRLVLVLLLAAVASYPVARAEHPPAPVSGEEAIARYAANLRAFPFYTCRYTVTKAEAYTFEDARAGRWVNAVSGDCRLVVDGGKELWTGKVPPPPPGGPPPVQPGQWIASGLLRFDDFYYLADGEFGISDVRGLWGACNLFTRERPFDVVEPRPVGMGGSTSTGFYSPPDILLADPDGMTFTDRGVREADGRRVHQLFFVKTYSSSNGPPTSTAYSFHLDPARGYLPVYAAIDSPNDPSLDGRPVEQIYLLQARDCGGGRWFPQRVLFVRALIRPGVSHLVQEMRVTELDVANRPAADTFRVTLPTSRRVWSGADPKKGFRLPAGATITADDLPALYREWEASGPPPSRWARLFDRRFAPWLWVGTMAAITLALAALVYRAWRRALARRAAQG